MAITMKNLNDRIATLEGKTSTTPITMKGLSDRLDNIEATAKDWAVVNLGTNSTNPTLSFDSKYSNYNYAIVSASVNMYQRGSSSDITISTSNTNVNAKTKGSFKISKSTNSFKISIDMSGYYIRNVSLTVIFYK